MKRRTRRRGCGGDRAQPCRRRARHRLGARPSDRRARRASRLRRDAIALMWDGFAGDGPHRARGSSTQLGAGRALAFSRLDDWLPAAARRPPIEGLRLCLAALPDDSTPAAIAATLPVGIAALLRSRERQGAGAARSVARHRRRFPAHGRRRAQPRRALVADALDTLSDDRHRQRLGRRRPSRRAS